MEEKLRAYKKRTNKELQKQITQAVKRANTIVESAENVKTSALWKSQVEHLKEIGLAGKRNTFAGNTKGLSKSELVLRLRELEYFNDWDIESTYGRRRMENREQKAFEEFLKENPNWKYEEWREMVEVTGALGDDFVKTNYSSDDIKELMERAGNQDIDNYSVLKALKDSVDEKKGLTQTLRMDDVYMRLGIKV